ncbi:MAG: class I SAM-dependent methyltransferase [Actinobacteria bacterium]|nr:class I SAM-dependent methyltransferase [Actinomycetota bacterium]
MVIDLESTLIEKMECRSCGGGFMLRDMHAHKAPHPINEGILLCTGCGNTLRVREGILDCSPQTDRQHRYWDEHYETEDQNPIAVAIERGVQNPGVLRSHYPLLRMIEGLALPMESSIELGCGSGAFSLLLNLTEAVGSTTLLDYSWPSLRAAGDLFARFNQSCNLVYARLEHAPFKKKAFSLAFSAGVIEHYRTDDERRRCLEAHLDCGNLAFVQAPVGAPGYWLPRIAVTVLKRGWPFGYERPVTMREIKTLINASGAELIKKDHQYFLSFPLFTRIGRLIRPGWYTWPLQNEIAVLAAR